MRTEEKLNVKNSVSRLLLVSLSILLQIGWLLLLVIRLNTYSVWISAASTVLALFLVLHIYVSHTNAAFKMPWILILLIFPPLGLLLWVMFGHPGATAAMRKKFADTQYRYDKYRQQPDAAMRQAEALDPAAANQMRYICDHAGYPAFTGTKVEYYGDTMEALLAQLEALESAEHFIFMEYHAIEEAEAFSMIRDVLARKAAEGVEVRLFYDDVGSIGFINLDFVERMEALGIQCRDFNPVKPMLNIFMNNRDHRKITIIDGKIGFTGGYNLADEYFNMTHPYGEWKDTGVKLTGAAVRNLTMMFLEIWNGERHTDAMITKYLPDVYEDDAQGFVQPYADTPLDGEYVGENVYLNLIGYAKYRLYITTPYLIISDEMTRALTLAAKRGVDVRIVTPGIPDKKVIYKVTRSYYAQLVRQGVRIYEYTPGFMHAKQMLCDTDAAVIGTINMDYRSLYHHFENGVFMWKCPAIADMAEDFDSIFKKCADVTAKYKERSRAMRMGEALLRLLAPLL